MASGRWHSMGRPVVYLAETPAGAMLEVLVHLEVDPEDIPDNLRLLRVEIPDQVASIRVPDALPNEWEDLLPATHCIGDAWLAKGETLLLQVPSAIMLHTTNYLLNPAHADTRLVSVTVETLRLDRRLFR